jgi:uncharacterized UBP type Zn finger protein
VSETEQWSERAKLIINRHYVAFVRKHLPEDDNKSRSWVLFNDEKVVKAADVDEMKKYAELFPNSCGHLLTS